MAVEHVGEDLYWLPPRAALAPKDNSKTLQVGVIGAGIGGFMAAIALLESGHDVEVGEFTPSVIQAVRLKETLAQNRFTRNLNSRTKWEQPLWRPPTRPASWHSTASILNEP